MKTVYFLCVSLVLVLFPISLVAQPQIIAHRGHWKAPGCAKNSVAALRAAHQVGAWGSEFDVQMSADGVLFVFHDNTLALDAKHPDQKSAIAEQNWDKMQSLTIANGEQMPTLQHYLEVGKHFAPMKLVLELKPQPTPQREQQAVERVVAMLRKMHLQEQVVFISFSPYMCDAFTQLLPEVPVLVLTSRVSPRQAWKKHYQGVDYQFGMFQKDTMLMHTCQELGLKTNAWTVNTDEIFDYLVFQKVDYITTDRPDHFIQKLAEME